MPIGSRLAGAGTGALTGAGAGSIFGPIGSGIGAGIGALTGYLGSRTPKGSSSGGGLFTRPGEEKRFDIYTPEQKQLLSQLLGALTGQGGPQGGLVGDLFGEKGFESYAAPLKRQFQEEIVPGLAERFSSFGGPGAASSQRSSAFQQQLARAGEDLTTRLGELRANQQQALFGNLLSSVLSPQQHIQYQPGGPTGFAQALAGLGQGAAQGLTSQGLTALFDFLKNRSNNPSGNQNFGQGSYSSIEPNNYGQTYYTR